MAFHTQSDQEMMSEINVTPLVDVMLVLLVVFIVTAPLLSQSLVVNLPKTVAVAGGARPAATGQYTVVCEVRDPSPTPPTNRAVDLCRCVYLSRQQKIRISVRPCHRHER